ncbi:protein of unknown function [Nitrospira japonica]|uniref:Uncharacterized protein n=1 Tax=Nitrospira japonica TaxID=1325564 RepID=A0A1W1I163_9BACT|nr:protein of unknown function [Nitrospira japonica]
MKSLGTRSWTNHRIARRSALVPRADGRSLDALRSVPEDRGEIWKEKLAGGLGIEPR